MKETPVLTYAEAVLLAQRSILMANVDSHVLGINVTSPSAIFGTTRGLLEEFGPTRVIETPSSENAITGVCLGLATAGHFPILIHQRMDFAILSLDMLINQVAKWDYMYGGKLNAGMLIRMIIGRGWGQGPQHSQALHNFFVHIPGFRVYLPTTPQDAYLAILKSSKTKEPTIVFEHRWLYELTGQVDISIQDENLLGTRIVHSHKQSKVTLVTISFSTLEALRAQTFLSENSVEVDIIEVIRLDTLDLQPILESIRKTEKLVIMDIGHRKAGVASSILAELIKCNIQLSCPPVIIGLPEYPTPTAPSLSRHYYPKPFEVANTVMNLLELPQMTIDPDENSQLDIPENRFIGYY